MTLAIWSEGTEKVLIRVLQPEKEKGTATLKVGSDIWNYLPKIDRTIRIPTSMMMASWMGSHFTNDDLVKESSISRDYEAKITGKQALPDGQCYVLDLIPRPEAAVVWGKITAYVRMSDHIPLKYEFFDEKGKLIRYQDLSVIKKMGGRTIPTVMTMIPVTKKGKKTVLVIDKINFNVPISDDVFSLSKLKGGTTR